MVQHFANQIYNVALRFTDHPNEAEDILQETLIKACRGVKTFEGRSSLGTWLYRIATNNSLMYLRRRQMPTVSLDIPPKTEVDFFKPPQLHDWHREPESIALTAELKQKMDEAVTSLPHTLRAAFVLRDLEGFSTKEAAEALNISPANLKVRLHRARLLLRAYMAAYFSEQAANDRGVA